MLMILISSYGFVCVVLHTLNRMYRLQLRQNTPKDRVLLVEPRRRVYGDKDLRIPMLNDTFATFACVHTHRLGASQR
jgi:hypothetical protein